MRGSREYVTGDRSYLNYSKAVKRRLTAHP
jgi:hypothetical protein